MKTISWPMAFLLGVGLTGCVDHISTPSAPAEQCAQDTDCPATTEPCQVAVCDPDTHLCATAPILGKDTDGDGFVDAACLGGNDCDDTNKDVHPGIKEGFRFLGTCADGLDNNCDGKADAADDLCPPLKPMCLANDICFSNPTPHGLSITSLWGFGADDLWGAGLYGTFIHWDGQSWSARETGVTVNLNGVWGATTDDLWIVGGGGTILRWNGNILVPATSTTTNALNAVAGTSASNVWAVGASKTVLRWEGSA